MFSNDYVSEFRLNLNQNEGLLYTWLSVYTLPTLLFLIRFTWRSFLTLPKRGGKTTWRHVCRLKIFSNLNWSLSSSFVQFKTGVKSTLASKIKELGAIYTFGILKLNKFEPGLILVNKNDEKHLDWRWWRCGWTSCEVVGSVQQRNETKQNCSFTRTRKMRK